MPALRYEIESPVPDPAYNPAALVAEHEHGHRYTAWPVGVDEHNR